MLAQVYQLAELFRKPTGLLFWIVVCGALLGLQRERHPLMFIPDLCLTAVMCAVLIWGYLEPRHQVSSSYKTCDRRIYKMAMIGTSRPGNVCCCNGPKNSESLHQRTPWCWASGKASRTCA